MIFTVALQTDFYCTRRDHDYVYCIEYLLSYSTLEYTFKVRETSE